jgi:O-acetyl-ADP-ribose deacetylase (regulator of RNase III)
MRLIESMIEIRKGSIETASNEFGVDAIVNCADPTLMGSDNNVDGAIHRVIDRRAGESGYFKKKIKEEFKGKYHSEKEKIIRCQRGEAVITKGYGLCDYVIHAVGPKSDRNDGKINGYSSSCVEKLTSCYKNIMDLVFDHQGIERIAIPVISSGNYGYDFEYAFIIGLTTVYNALLEKKQNMKELFDYISLKKVYFVVYDANDNWNTACRVYERYKKAFRREHRVVIRGTVKSQQEFRKEISLYDEQKGYFAVAKLFRKLLITLRIILGFWTYLKDVISKEDWVIRRQTVEITVFIKMFLPLLFIELLDLCNNRKLCGILLFIIVYDLMDTVTYLIALMILADIQRPSANVCRSLLMLIVNYIEVELDIVAIYYFINFLGEDKKSWMDILNYIMGIQNETNTIQWLAFVNGGIQFFFLTIALSYFINHIRLRKFRTY